MANRQKKKRAHRRRKALSVRRRLRGSSERPRLSVFRSLKNIYCQIIDDEQGRTIVAASSQDRNLRDQLTGLSRLDVAARVGAAIAERARTAGVSKVAFDRGPFKYHGRIKALAEAARAAGLEF